MNAAPGWTSCEPRERSSSGDCSGARAPVLVVSHAPPLGVGDCAADPYHVGYRAYRWFLERAAPPLWLHGHTTPASVTDWRAGLGDSKVVNVTGSVVVELLPPGSSNGGAPEAAASH